MKKKLFLPALGALMMMLSGFMAASEVTDPSIAGNLIMRDTMRAPVILMNDTLFYLVQPIGIYTSQERVKRINTILQGILEERNVSLDSFHILISEPNYYLFYKDLPVMAVYPTDTTGLHISPGDLASVFMAAIKTGFQENLTAYNLKTISRNVLNTGIIILLVLLVAFILNWIFRKLFHYLEVRKTRFFKGWHIRDYALMPTDQQFKFILNLLRLFKLALIIFTVFIALPAIFTLFPATEGITRKLVSMIWNPVQKILLGIVGYIPDLITIIVIYIIFRYFLKGLKFLTHEISEGKLDIPGFYPEWARPTFMILRFVLYIFMFIMIFPFLPGSDSDIFKGVSVFVGLLISIGSSSAIANAVAGIVITYMRPFRVGDRIKIDDITGTVMEKSALVTRIRTIKNEDVTIPNSKILTSHTVNYSDPARETGLIIHTTVTIGYDAPWRTVHRLLLEAAESTNGILKKPPPFVLQTSLDDFYISYQINAYIADANRMLQIKSQLHQNIQDCFNRGGVEIMSPHYRSERDGNEITIPKHWEEEAERTKEIPVKAGTVPKKRGRKPKAT